MPVKSRASGALQCHVSAPPCLLSPHHTSIPTSISLSFRLEIWSHLVLRVLIVITPSACTVTVNIGIENKIQHRKQNIEWKQAVSREVVLEKKSFKLILLFFSFGCALISFRTVSCCAIFILYFLYLIFIFILSFSSHLSLCAINTSDYFNLKITDEMNQCWMFWDVPDRRSCWEKVNQLTFTLGDQASVGQTSQQDTYKAFFSTLSCNL